MVQIYAYNPINERIYLTNDFDSSIPLLYLSVKVSLNSGFDADDHRIYNSFRQL